LRWERGKSLNDLDDGTGRSIIAQALSRKIYPVGVLAPGGPIFALSQKRLLHSPRLTGWNGVSYDTNGNLKNDTFNTYT
jgi:hypothetical protein